MKEELSLALEKSFHWTNEQRRHDTLNGFGKGQSWGAHCLEHFFPDWFKKVWKNLNWLNTGLINGETSFWHLIEAYGWNQDKFWFFADLFIEKSQIQKCQGVDKWYGYEYEAEYNGLC